MSDEGDFKKGRVSPAAIGIALGVLGIGAGIAFMAKRTTETTLRPEEIAAQVRKVLVKPQKEQVAAWRKVVDDTGSDERLKQEAIFQLARLRDAESLPRFLKMLPDATNHATVRVLSMALLEFPRKDVEPAKKALEAKLESANNEDQPQIAAALIYIRDKASYAKILGLYKSDVMKSARGVDGASSFDPQDLALLTDRDTFRKLASDSQAGVRQLVATVLSEAPTKDDLSALETLLDDKDLEVSSEASVGIAKLNDAGASKLLIEKLADAEKTDNETARKRYIEALKNGIGGAGLVYALEVVPMNDDLEARGRFIMEELRTMADPSAADAYKAYLKDTTHPAHYRSQIALALADIGDPDAVPYLAARMDARGIGFNCGPAPEEKCLSNNLGWKRQAPVDADPVTFREQQISAQDIGDLALLYPEKKADFLAVSAAHIKKFDKWFPAPWLVDIRALAYLGDAETGDWCKKTIHDFKTPKDTQVDPLTLELTAFDTAARFLDASRDDSQIDVLGKLLERPHDSRGNDVKLSQEAMETAQNPGYREALINMTMGSIEGLAEWGKPAERVADKLVKLAKDKDHGLFPRQMAGQALGLVGSEKDVLDALKQAKASPDFDFKLAVLRGAQRHATPEIAATALDLMVDTPDPSAVQVNMWAARVVGWGGTKGLEDKLMKLLDSKTMRVYSALAIALGGDDDLVRQGMATFEQKSRDDDKWQSDLNGLRALYLDTFDELPISADDVDQGRLFRFVHNTDVMKRAGASDDQGDSGGTAHEWAAVYLAAGFKRLNMSATATGAIDRLILRTKLIKAAKLSDDRIKQQAIDALKFLREQGVIMSLRQEAGSTGEMARKAYFELRHPEAKMGPADKDKDPAKDDHKVMATPKGMSEKK